MEMPDAIYAKKGKEAIVYSTIKISGNDVVEYVRADKVAIKLAELLEALNVKNEKMLDEMKEILGYE